MKIRYTRNLKDGRTHALVELAPAETMPNRVIDGKAMYRLGYPVHEVVRGNIISEARRVYWCPLGQKWEDE